MTQNFIIKEGEKYTFCITLIGLSFFLILFLQSKSYAILSPIILFFSIAVLANMILFFRWAISFVVFLDMEKEELILNHSLFFRKKKISLKDIKELDMLNGEIIVFASTPLSKWQRFISKTKNSTDYTIRFPAIAASEKRELIKLLSTWKNKSEE